MTTCRAGRRQTPTASAPVAALVATLAVVLTLLQAPPATAAAPTDLVVRAARQYAGETTPLKMRLATAAGAPIADATLRVLRMWRGRWREPAWVRTGELGWAALDVRLSKDPANNRFRVVYPGSADYAARTEERQVRLRRRPSALSLWGPGQVIDGRRVGLRARWTLADGRPLAGGEVTFHRRSGGAWRREGTVRTDRRGLAVTRVRPRTTTRWRATVAARTWVAGAASGVHRVVNLPPGDPVQLPAGAPAPRISLPHPPRAVGAGANPSISRIPDAVWNHMVGRSWHRGCPVGRQDLRLLRINHWGYDGYRYRGELVARWDAVDNMAAALTAMYRRGIPVRAIHRVDRFGWSGRLNGADDYRSMAVGNTSAFNCRDVVGRPGVRSPHSYGRSLDLNPWENPYRSATDGWVPNSWWVSRSHPLVAWRDAGHQVVRLMADHGLRWTYGVADAHHFDVGSSGRTARELHPQCGDFVCE